MSKIKLYAHPAGDLFQSQKWIHTHREPVSLQKLLAAITSEAESLPPSTPSNSAPSFGKTSLGDHHPALRLTLTRLWFWQGPSERVTDIPKIPERQDGTGKWVRLWAAQRSSGRRLSAGHMLPQGRRAEGHLSYAGDSISMFYFTLHSHWMTFRGNNNSICVHFSISGRKKCQS